MKEFRTGICKSSHKSASIEHNSTARIINLTIENEDIATYQIALEWDQIDDLINLCDQISQVKYNFK